jgi:hypothetical protein
MYPKMLQRLRHGLVHKNVPSSHQGCLKGGRTRSSPIGPAEHDDGGSLHNSVNVSHISSNISLIPNVKLLMISCMGPRLCNRPTKKPGGGEKKRVNVPAQVCEFLVDSLQRHRDGCVCLLGVLRLFEVEGVAVLEGAVKPFEVLGQSSLATKTRERLC